MDIIPKSYNPGLMGKNYDAHRIMMVLHYSDSRAPIPHEDDGYKAALLSTETGKYILEMLDKGNKTLDDVFLTNYVKDIRKGDRPPLRKQYEVSKSILQEQIKVYAPQKMVTFGAPVYRHFFDGKTRFDEAMLSIKTYDSIPVFISNHPSHMRLVGPIKRKECIDSIASFLQ